MSLHLFVLVRCTKISECGISGCLKTIKTGILLSSRVVGSNRLRLIDCLYAGSFSGLLQRSKSGS